MTAALPTALRRSAAHVFVASLDAPELDPGDVHHLQRALRLRDGTEVTVTDGAGNWSLGVFATGAVDLIGERRHVTAPRRNVTIAAAIPKGDRVEWMVHKLTELGAAHIILLDCARSVVRWDGERATGHVDRLRKVVREAAMQSRRTRLPDVLGPVRVDELCRRPEVLVADPDGLPLQLMGDRVTVAIGPEGGFTSAETAGATLVSLSDHVLRVETAAIAAAVLLCQ